jgi:hypothetical protein
MRRQVLLSLLVMQWCLGSKGGAPTNDFSIVQGKVQEG